MENQAGPGRDDGPRRGEQLPQHPLVTRLKQDASQPAQRFTIMEGLPGDQDQEGVQRLYLNPQLDYYAEFNLSDMLQTELVPADRSSFPGIEATRVFIARDAIIKYTWVRSSQPVDQFDLDTRLGMVPPPTGLSLGRQAPGFVPLVRYNISDDCALRYNISDECVQFELVWRSVPREQR